VSGADRRRGISRDAARKQAERFLREELTGWRGLLRRLGIRTIPVETAVRERVFRFANRKYRILTGTW